MVNISITIHNNVECMYFLKEKDIVDLYSLVSDDLESICKKLYNSYEKNKHVVNYHFEYDGALFDEKMKFECREDMAFTMKLQIAERNKKNTGVLYDSES